MIEIDMLERTLQAGDSIHQTFSPSLSLSLRSVFLLLLSSCVCRVVCVCVNTCDKNVAESDEIITITFSSFLSSFLFFL